MTAGGVGEDLAGGLGPLHGWQRPFQPSMKVRNRVDQFGSGGTGAGRIPCRCDGRAAVTSEQGAVADVAGAGRQSGRDLLGKLRTTLGGLQVGPLRRVAAAVLGAGDSRVTCAALLHDVVEKTEITVDDLLARTGDFEFRLVGILTRRDSDSDTEYLTRCAADPLTLLVKRADWQTSSEADDTTVPDAAAEQIRNQARNVCFCSTCSRPKPATDRLRATYPTPGLGAEDEQGAVRAHAGRPP